MLHITSSALAYLFALLAVCGLGYLLLTLVAALRFLRSPQPKPGSFTPTVSILKPLRGTDREMYEGFRSHCLQDYPEFEIIFGVQSLADPAVRDVERLKQEFPERAITLVECPVLLGTNGKVSALAQMLPHARYEHILINDSDIRVPRTYLKNVMSHFADAKVGLVTALYRAHAGATLASRVEAVTVGTDFAGGVLSALVVDGGMHFALGSTLAMPRRVLAEIGGFEPLFDYLADDYELGARVSRAGYKVALTNAVVDTFLHDYGFSGMMQHQLRWARTVRDMRKWGYLGVLVTFALPWAVLAALFAHGAFWSWVLLFDVLLVRLVAAATLCGPVLRDSRTMRDLWLVPLRDFLGLVIWAASFASDTVIWRGEVFHLKDGKLTRAV